MPALRIGPAWQKNIMVESKEMFEAYLKVSCGSAAKEDVMHFVANTK